MKGVVTSDHDTVLTGKEREWLLAMPSWADHTSPERGFVNGDAIIEKFEALVAERNEARREADQYRWRGPALVRAEAAEAREAQLRKVANGLLWMHDNSHNYGTPEWLEYFNAAVDDARAALAGAEA